MSISETSNNAHASAVSGTNTAGGDGVVGTGRRGVVGISDTYQGVYGRSIDNAGVVGESDKLHGIYGYSRNPHGAGVFGTNEQEGGFGVQGVNLVGDGVIGTGRRGVVGTSDTYQGVYGRSIDNAGVVGESDKLHGIYGYSRNPHGAGVFGTNEQEGGFGVQGVNLVGDGVIGTGRRGVVGTSNAPGGVAGFFEGNVEVTGDVSLIGADCAEEFTVAEDRDADPGTVMVLDNDGNVAPSASAYDKRVAGVLSGAGDFRPGVVLDKSGAGPHRKPLALMGKVYCKVDAGYGQIGIGDLLTTSPTPGHAMKATDLARAFGAVIGKALRPLKEGRGLVPILVALQ